MASKSKLIQAILGRLAVPAPTRSGGKARVEPHLGPSNTPGPVQKPTPPSIDSLRPAPPLGTPTSRLQSAEQTLQRLQQVDEEVRAGGQIPLDDNSPDVVLPEVLRDAENAVKEAQGAVDERMLGPTPQRPPPPPVPDRPTGSLEEIGLDHDQLSPNGVPLGADVSRRHVLNKASDEQFSEVMGLEQAILAKNRSAQADIDSIFTSTTEVEDALVQLRSLHEIPREGSVRDLATQLDELGIDRGVIKDVNKRQGVLGLRKLLNDHEAKSSPIDNNTLLDDFDNSPEVVQARALQDTPYEGEFRDLPLEQRIERLKADRTVRDNEVAVGRVQDDDADDLLSEAIRELEAEMGPRVGQPQSFPSDNPSQGLPPTQDPVVLGQQSESIPLPSREVKAAQTGAEVEARLARGDQVAASGDAFDPTIGAYKGHMNPIRLKKELTRLGVSPEEIQGIRQSVKTQGEFLTAMFNRIREIEAASSPIDTPF